MEPLGSERHRREGQSPSERERASQFRDAANAVTMRIFAQGQHNGTTPYFFTRDHLGSVREVLSGGGTVVARYDYDPYGRSTTILGTTPTDMNFTGLYRHAKSNLDFAVYRAYDPDFGRWLNRDPIEEAGGMNLYGYVANVPVRFVDPLGLELLDGRTALDDFIEQYTNMHRANWKNSDKYFHCLANCNAARRGGIDAFDARLWSDLRENFDYYVKGDSLAACAADQRANRDGREQGRKGKNCRQACAKYRPPGLPPQF